MKLLFWDGLEGRFLSFTFCTSNRMRWMESFEWIYCPERAQSLRADSVESFAHPKHLSRSKPYRQCQSFAAPRFESHRGNGSFIHLEVSIQLLPSVTDFSACRDPRWRTPGSQNCLPSETSKWLHRFQSVWSFFFILRAKAFLHLHGMQPNIITEDLISHLCNT